MTTENTTDKSETDADLPEEATETDDVLEGPAGTDDYDPDWDEDGAPDEKGAPGRGVVSGGFGFAGLALAVVSLTTNWTSSVMVSHSQYSAEVGAGSSGLAAQQQLDLAVNGWHTQAWWALGFAVAAVLCGAGALFLPKIVRKSGTPGWAGAAATGAVIVGLVGVVLAVLTVAGVLGGQLTA